MKRILSVLIVLSLSLTIFAQRKDITPLLNMEGVLKTSFASFPKGSPVLVMGVISLKNQPENNGIFLSVSINNQQIPVPAYRAKDILDVHPKNMEEFWMWEYIKADMFDYYDSKGYSTSLRNELIEESIDYLNGISDLFYEDPLVLNYVHSIFIKVTPRKFNTSRIERANVKIVQTPDPYANMLANGTLLISTGLLSILDSEEELTAIIASNIAHYVLDHPVINVKKQISRARRAEFWGGFLIAVADGVEQALYENNDNYIPGGIMLTAAVASDALNYSAAMRLGTGFSNKQFKEADRLAMDYLKFRDIDPAAMSSVLYKINQYYRVFPNSTSVENFPNLKKRIKDLKQPRKEFENRIYQRRISGVNTLNAIIQLNSGYTEEAQRLVGKNIESNLASDEDYVVLVKAKMQDASTDEEIEKCLELIQKGKSLSEIPNLELFKQEILVLIRLEKKMKAYEVNKEYITLLTDFKDTTKSSDDLTWAEKELNWATKLHNQIIKF